MPGRSKGSPRLHYILSLVLRIVKILLTIFDEHHVVVPSTFLGLPLPPFLLNAVKRHHPSRCVVSFSFLSRDLLRLWAKEIPTKHMRRSNHRWSSARPLCFWRRDFILTRFSLHWHCLHPIIWRSCYLTRLFIENIKFNLSPEDRKVCLPSD